MTAITEKRYYTLNSTPWYFGAYLNLARHNLAIVLNDLSIKLGKNAVDDDANLKSTRAFTILTDPGAKPNDLQKALDYFDKRLPFLFAMHYKCHKENEKDDGKAEKPVTRLSATPEGYAVILNKLIEILNSARNYYSHYTAGVAFSVPKDFFYLLNDAFDVNVRLVKRRFELEEEEIDHLRRLKPNKDGNRKIKTIPNPAFKYWFNKKDDKYAFTEFGLAFFICLFLRPGDAFLFLKKISGFKLGDSRSKKASLDAYCINNIQLPIERLESDNSAQALFLDMCNELAKAPGELYETLRSEDQKMFITKQVDVENEPDDQSEEEPELETKMVRKNNRFTFFAQRYMDVSGAFPSLRFAVDLGLYHYSIYPKVIAGTEESRHLIRHLIGYGKLEDFAINKRSDEYKSKYLTIEQTNQLLPDQFIPETYAHYHLANNMVAISLEEGKPYWPSLATEPTNGQKSYPNKYIKSKGMAKKPYVYISLHEMPAMLFFTLVQDKKSAQEIIVQHVKKVKTFFNKVKSGDIKPVSAIPIQNPAVQEIIGRSNTEYNSRYAVLTELLEEYGCRPEYLPEKLVNYLLGIAQRTVEYDLGKAAQRLTRMIEESAMNIEKMELREKSEIKPGKRAFQKIKVGKLADRLAEDMLLMQPAIKGPDGKCLPSSKANSTAFRVLQSHLAYFGLYKDKISDVFKACKLVDGENPHPFLHQISIPDQVGIIEFYKAYYEAKIRFLTTCKEEKKYGEYHFLKVKSSQYEINQMIDEYLNTNMENGYSAFNLPRGIFHKAAMDYFKHHGSPAMQAYVQQYENSSNSVHLINYYFEQEHKDTSPDFYRCKRQYELFTTPFSKDGRNNYYSLEERSQLFPDIKKAVKSTEKQMDQLKIRAGKDKQELGKALRKYQGIPEMINYLITRYQKAYPGMGAIKYVQFRNEDGYRKVVNKASVIIDDYIGNMERRSKAYHKFIDNEQYLRLTEAQDKLIFMCVKRMLANDSNKLQLLNESETSIQNNDGFLLKNITAPNNPAVNKSILNCKPAHGISFTHPFYAVNEKGEMVKENGRQKQLGEVAIVDRHCKIKNNGNFRKLMKDRRINNLCFYFIPDKEGVIKLNRNVLENELQEFERQRLAVLEVIAEFERVLYTRVKNQAANLLYRDGVQQHKLYLSYYFAMYGSGNEEIMVILNAIRNGFLHNQFPVMPDKQFQLSPDGWGAINDAYRPAATGSTGGYGIIDKIAALAIEQYTQMIKKINQS